MTKYGLPAFLATLVLALILAAFAGPALADWIADRAGSYPYGYRYAYGYAEEPLWPVGSIGLILALTGFALLGAAIMALVWGIAEASRPVEPDPAEERVRKVARVVASVNRRDDLTSGEKEAFRTSAEALARSGDASAIRAAEAVGRENAVVAASELAQQAEDEMLRLLAHAANIAAPFSDAASTRIARRRGHFADLDTLVGAREKCGKPMKRHAKDCECGADECELLECDGARKGNHARLDVVWD